MPPRGEEISRDRSFDELATEVIDNVLRSILGSGAAEIVFRRLRNEGITGQDGVISDMDAFSASLESLFGSGGALLERQILERLYSRLGLTFEEKKGYSFGDYMGRLREKVDAEK
ncbi:MAG: hypothetical protein QW390_03245 [Candidatus Bathyarchaeia archaeon]